MNLPDALLERARERAASERRTVTSLVEEALRTLLDGRRPTSAVVLPTDGHPDGLMLVDLDDPQVMRALLHDDDLTGILDAPRHR